MAVKLTAEHDEARSRSGHWIEQAYLAYKDELLTTVMCLLGGHRSTAEDVLHDVFVAVAKPARTVIKKNVRNYLITACLNRARDVLRRRDARASSSDEVIHGACSQADPAQTLDLEEEANRVFVALANLPAAQREVVAMHIHGQMRFREIAETLGISINTVQSRYRYALAALRKLLTDGNERGVFKC